MTTLRPRLRYGLFAAAVSAASLAVAMGGCELFLRLQHRARLAQLWAGVNHPRCVEASPERELIYRLVPGRCGANARGYLDREHTLDKPPGVFRIVVIGDSVAEASGVDPTAGFGSVLERLLNDRGKRRHEVIKLARPGYSTRQELYVLEHEAFAYHPDLVVWSYVLNDPVDSRYRHGLNQMSELYRPRSYLWHLVETALSNYRHQRARARCGDVEWRLLLHCEHRDEIEAQLARIAALTRSQGVPLLFVIHPVLERGKTFDHYSFAGLHAALRALAGAQGFSVVDLFDAYRGHPPAELAQSPSEGDDTHPNALGHALAAAAIARQIAASD